MMALGTLGYRLLVLLLVLLPGISWAQDCIVDRAWVEDAGGQMSLVQAQAATAHAFDGVLSRGYSTSVFWLRLRVDPHRAGCSGSTTDPLVLTMVPPLVQSILLYDPVFHDDGVRVTGSAHPWQGEDKRSLGFNFVIPRGSAPRTLWLRLRTSSSVVLGVQALGPADFVIEDQRQQLFASLLLAVMLMFLLWAVLLWLLERDALVGLFIAKESLGLGLALYFLGYWRLLWPLAMEGRPMVLLAQSLITTYTLVSVAFDYRMLQRFHAQRWGLRLLGLVALLVASEYGLLALDLPIIAMRLNVWIAMCAPLLTFGMACSAQAWDHPDPGHEPNLPRWALIGGYGLMSAALLIHTAPMLGLVRASDFSIHALMYYNLINGLVLISMLQIDAWRRKLRLQFTEQSLALEQARSSEQQRFLDMLAHELKTPLAVVRMALGQQQLGPVQRGAMRKAVSDMNTLIDHCLQAGRIDTLSAPVDLQCIDLDALLAELIDSAACRERVRLDLQPGLQLRTDPMLLRVVLQNMLDNALKYGAAHEPICVQAKLSIDAGRSGIGICITNTVGAVGWPDPDHVFDRYYRSPGARQHTGSGLGLHIVAGLVRNLGGLVRYTPQPDQDLVAFTLWLPV